METKILPLVLISASDEITASNIITDLVEENLKEPKIEALCQTWRIENKYYKVNVLLHSLIDGERFNNSNVEAHIIYLDANECESTVCESRYEPVKNNLSHNSVKLVAAQCGEIPDSLSEWAQDSHYEIIPLLECGPESEPDDPFPELYGMDRLRAALHAHMWPGHIRLDRTNQSSILNAEDSDEEAAIQRAEEFIETLSLLPAAIDLPLEERRQRAEELVTAFCKALGHDLLAEDIDDR